MQVRVLRIMKEALESKLATAARSLPRINAVNHLPHRGKPLEDDAESRQLSLLLFTDCIRRLGYGILGNRRIDGLPKCAAVDRVEFVRGLPSGRKSILH